MLVCASKTSVAVLLMAPVMARVAMRWMEAIRLATPIDPCCSSLEVSVNAGLNQRLAAYIILGTAMA